MKKEDFIGVWKLLEYGEGKIITSQTHLVVQENQLWEVHPSTIYYENKPGPEVGYSFEEGKAGQPAKVSLASGFKYLVKKEGNTLWMKLGPVFGSFPKSFEDSGNVGIYQLETGTKAKELATPPPRVPVQELKIRGLGTLQYDSNLEWWTAATKFQGKKINLHIAAEKDNKFEPLERIKEQLKQLAKHSFEQIAAEYLLNLYNETWSEEEEAISQEEFASRVTINSITLEVDGTASIWLLDGDLFAGHDIQIALDEQQQVLEVGIAG